MNMKRKRENSLNADYDDSDNEGSEVIQVENNVYFHSDVTKQSILLLVKALNKAAKVIMTEFTSCKDVLNRGKVYLYIHSDGGDAYAGISAMAHIRRCPVEVVTIADGFVASAATFLLLAGKERRMCINSKILIHQLRTEFWGKYSDLLDEVKNTKDLMRTIKMIYKKNTSMHKTRINDLLKTELVLNAQKCLDDNIVHVIEPY